MVTFTQEKTEKERQAERGGMEADKQNRGKKRSRETNKRAKISSLTSFRRVIQEGRQLGKLTWITTGQQEEEEGDEGVCDWGLTRGLDRGGGESVDRTREGEEDKCCSQMKTKG